MKHITQFSLVALFFTFVLPGGSPPSATAATPLTGQLRIISKAQNITLPEFKLNGVTLWEAVRQLRVAGRQHDTDGKGVNFIVTAVDKEYPKITLALKNVTLADATERLAEAAGVLVSAEGYAFVFSAKPSRP